MAINIATTKAAAIASAKANIKTAMATAYGEPEATYDEFAGIIANGVGEAIEDALTEIKTNADVTGVTAGSDTVAGGVD